MLTSEGKYNDCRYHCFLDHHRKFRAVMLETATVVTGDDILIIIVMKIGICVLGSPTQFDDASPRPPRAYLL